MDLLILVPVVSLYGLLITKDMGWKYKMIPLTGMGLSVGFAGLIVYILFRGCDGCRHGHRDHV